MHSRNIFLHSSGIELSFCVRQIYTIIVYYSSSVKSTSSSTLMCNWQLTAPDIWYNVVWNWFQTVDKESGAGLELNFGGGHKLKTGFIVLDNLEPPTGAFWQTNYFSPLFSVNLRMVPLSYPSLKNLLFTFLYFSLVPQNYTFLNKNTKNWICVYQPPFLL